MAKRKRRSFTPEFKAEAVQLCLAGDRSISQVADDLDLTESSLRAWVREVESQPAVAGSSLTSTEQDELKELRKRVKRLEVERDILKKAAADSSGERYAVTRANDATRSAAAKSTVGNAVAGDVDAMERGHLHERHRTYTRQAACDHLCPSRRARRLLAARSVSATGRAVALGTRGHRHLAIARPIAARRGDAAGQGGVDDQPRGGEERRAGRL